MRSPSRWLRALFLLRSTGIACDSPVAPSRPVGPLSRSFDGSSTGLPGRPITIGQLVEGDLPFNSNPMCDFGNNPYPCSRYSLEVPRTGKVVVQLDFVGGDRPMFIAFETPAFHASRDNFVAIGGSPLTGSFDVSAKQLTVAVGVDAPYGIGAAYRYRFVATLE